jgi:hypothetical protein
MRDKTFYYHPDTTRLLALLYVRCPHDGYVYACYHAVPREVRVSGVLRDAVLGNVLIALHREHPEHYCVDCGTSHREKECAL